MNQGRKFRRQNWLTDKFYLILLNTIQKVERSWRSNFSYVRTVVEIGLYLRNVVGEQIGEEKVFFSYKKKYKLFTAEAILPV